MKFSTGSTTNSNIAADSSVTIKDYLNPDYDRTPVGAIGIGKSLFLPAEFMTYALEGKSLNEMVDTFDSTIIGGRGSSDILYSIQKAAKSEFESGNMTSSDFDIDYITTALQSAPEQLSSSYYTEFSERILNGTFTADDVYLYTAMRLIGTEEGEDANNLAKAGYFAGHRALLEPKVDDDHRYDFEALKAIEFTVLDESPLIAPLEKKLYPEGGSEDYHAAVSALHSSGEATFNGQTVYLREVDPSVLPEGSYGSFVANTSSNENYILIANTVSPEWRNIIMVEELAAMNDHITTQAGHDSHGDEGHLTLVELIAEAQNANDETVLDAVPDAWRNATAAELRTQFMRASTANDMTEYTADNGDVIISEAFGDWFNVFVGAVVGVAVGAAVTAAAVWVAGPAGIALGVKAGLEAGVLAGALVGGVSGAVAGYEYGEEIKEEIKGAISDGSSLQHSNNPLLNPIGGDGGNGDGGDGNSNDGNSNDGNANSEGDGDGDGDDDAAPDLFPVHLDYEILRDYLVSTFELPGNEGRGEFEFFESIGLVSTVTHLNPPPHALSRGMWGAVRFESLRGQIELLGHGDALLEDVLNIVNVRAREYYANLHEVELPAYIPHINVQTIGNIVHNTVQYIYFLKVADEPDPANSDIVNDLVSENYHPEHSEVNMGDYKWIPKGLEDNEGDISGGLTWEVPIVLDLNDDGLEYNSDGVLFDTDGDGEKEQIAWIGADDGLLAYDIDGDSQITDINEISFAGYLEGAKTDLQGLAAFDTNQNGLLDSGDAEFDKFFVWQDLNQDGVSDEGELMGLLEAGIESLSLESDGNAQNPASGVHEFGQSTYTKTDGTTGVLGDVAFRVTEVSALSDSVVDKIVANLDEASRVQTAIVI